MTIVQTQTSAGSNQLRLHSYEPDSTAQSAPTIAELTYAYGGLTGRIHFVLVHVEHDRRKLRFAVDVDALPSWHMIFGWPFTTRLRTGLGSPIIAAVSSGLTVLPHSRWQEESLDLDTRTIAKARSNAQSLLEELGTDRGLGWSEISRLCGVSVSAVRKWRGGESPSPGRRRQLARLAAFLDLLEEAGGVSEPAGWMNIRLSDKHTVTPTDLYLAGQAEDLVTHAQGFLGINELLNRWRPDWQTATRSEWKVIEGPGGERTLTRRE